MHYILQKDAGILRIVGLGRVMCPVLRNLQLCKMMLSPSAHYDHDIVYSCTLQVTNA